MEAQIKALGGAVLVKVEAGNARELFEKIAEVQEVFADTSCGLCSSKSIRAVVRKRDKFKFYELQCDECRAYVEMGQITGQEHIWPKRWDSETRKAIGVRGWIKYKSENKAETQGSTAQQSKDSTHTTMQRRS